MVDLILQTFVVSLVLGCLLALLAIPVILGDRALMRRARSRYHQLWVQRQQQQQQPEEEDEGAEDVLVTEGAEKVMGEERPIPEQESVSWRELCSWSIPEQFHSLVGKQALVYFQLQKMTVLLFMLVTFLALVVILPINCTSEPEDYEVNNSIQEHNGLVQDNFFTGNTTISDNFARTTIEYAQLYPDRLWGHLISLIVCCCAMLSAGVLFNRDEQVLRHSQGLDENDMMAKRSILVQHLGKNCTVAQAKAQLEADLEIVMPHVVHIEVIPEISSFMKHHRRLASYFKKRQHAVALKMESKDGKRPTSLVCCCKRVDSIKHFDSRIQKTQNKLEKELEVVCDPTRSRCGSRAVVIFDSQKEAQHALSLTFRADNPCLAISTPSPAPPASDIQWENFCVSSPKRLALRVFWSTVFLLFIVFYSSPIAVWSSVAPAAESGSFSKILNWLTSWSPLVRHFVWQYLPSLALLLINLFLPDFIQFLVRLEKPPTYSEYVRSSVVRTTLYMIVGTIVMPSLALTTIEALMLYHERGGATNELFKNMFLPSSGAFFLTYIMQLLFLSNVASVLQLGKRLMRWISGMSGASLEELREIASPVEFEYLDEIPRFLCNSAVVFVYSMYVPLIAPVGLAFVALRHYIDKYNLMKRVCQGKRSQISRSPLVYKRITQMIFLVVLFTEFSWIAFFSIKRYVLHLVTTIVLFGFSLVYAIWWSMRHTKIEEETARCLAVSRSTSRTQWNESEFDIDAHARTVEELPAEDAYRPKQIVRLSDAPLQVMSRSDSRAENFGKRRATSSSSSSSSSSP